MTTSNKYMDDAVTAFRNGKVFQNIGYSSFDVSVYQASYIMAMRTDMTIAPERLRNSWKNGDKAHMKAFGMAHDDAAVDTADLA